MLGSVMTAMRSPGRGTSFLAKGFLRVLESEFNEAPPQPARLTATAAENPAQRRRIPIPRLRAGRNFEPPFASRKLFRRGAQRLRRPHDQRKHHIGAFS